LVEEIKESKVSPSRLLYWTKKLVRVILERPILEDDLAVLGVDVEAFKLLVEDLIELKEVK